MDDDHQAEKAFETAFLRLKSHRLLAGGLTHDQPIGSKSGLDCSIRTCEMLYTSERASGMFS